MSSPTVSVLMPVYNGKPFLEQALDSILGQDFQDFELVVVDDGSDDGTVELITSVMDQRLHVVSAGRVGLVAALNLGLQRCTGEFVARMDADDVSRSDRLGVQVEYLRTHHEIGLVCSDARLIDADGSVIGRHRTRWSTQQRLRQGLLYQRGMKPIIHPSVVLRRSIFASLDGYRDFRGAEDRDLWIRALDICAFACIHDELLDYRMHAGGVSREAASPQEVSSVMAAVNWLIQEQAGVDVFEAAPDLFSALHGKVEERLRVEMLPAATAYRAARAALRQRKPLSALGQVTAGSVRHRTLLRPDTARAAVSRIIIDTVADALKVIAQGK